MKKLLVGLYNRMHLFVGLILTVLGGYFLFEFAKKHSPVNNASQIVQFYGDQ